jgi:hypothetical protein
MKPRHAVALALDWYLKVPPLLRCSSSPTGFIIWLDPRFPAHKFLPSQLARHYAIGLTGC